MREAEGNRDPRTGDEGQEEITVEPVPRLEFALDSVIFTPTKMSRYRPNARVKRTLPSTA
jgi:hypothetical protein